MHTTTVWFNVTTSVNWNRPPVGIVRAERNIAEELCALLPAEMFKKCIWLDGSFVEYPTSSHEKQQLLQPVRQQDEKLSIQQTHEIRWVFPLVTRKTALMNIAQGCLSLAPAKIRPFLNNIMFKMKPRVGNIVNKIKHKRLKNQGPQLQPQTSDNIFKHPFHDGDVLVTLGLDWDYPYVAKLTELKEYGIKIISCCYDMIPILLPQYCLGYVAQKFADYFIDVTESATSVVCISKQSETDLQFFINNTGSRKVMTSVIRLGDNIPLQNGDICNTVKAIASSNYILFVSSIERRKNHEVLYRAYHLLCAQGHKKQLPKLVFIGMRGWGVDDLLHDIQEDPLTKGIIILLDQICDAELSLLYKNARFCVFPSMYEGWGLPVAEALALGKVILSSNAGSLPEVGGDLVEYIDPWNPHEWAKIILEYSTNTDKLKQKQEDIKKNYKVTTWKETAQQILTVINSINKENIHG